jgi:hypothetical protein
MPVSPALRRQWQEDHESEAKMGYIVSSRPARTIFLRYCLKKKKSPRVGGLVTSLWYYVGPSGKKLVLRTPTPLPLSWLTWSEQLPLPHMLLPWGTVLPQAQSNKAKQPWTETMSQNNSFLLLRGLSQVFCHSNTMLTKTVISFARNDNFKTHPSHHQCSTTIRSLSNLFKVIPLVPRIAPGS